MRGAALLVAGLVIPTLAGCVTLPEDDDRRASDARPVEPRMIEYYLRPGHRLDETPHNGSSPTREPAYPTANAYVNEDLEIFEGKPSPGYHVTSARLVVYYGVERPTTGQNPQQTNHFAFWVGSGDVYPNYKPWAGPGTLVRGNVYKADVTFDLAEGGWVLPPGEPLRLLVAPLVANTGDGNLHYLVDHEDTPSRLLLEVVPWTAPEPTPTEISTTPFRLMGNSGLFTGAAEYDNKARRDVTAPSNATLLRIDVDWQSTAAGKSDLDLTLLAADGTTPLAFSTTPYQEEHVRLFLPNLEALGRGPFVAEVNAYSGADTRFDLIISWVLGA